MKQNRNHNELDNFSKLIKDRLENHQLQVDDNCWLEIEERLNNNKRKPAIPLWSWISGGVAIVAAIALLLVFPPYNDFSQQSEIAKQTDSFSNEQLEQVIKSLNPQKEISPVSEASNFRDESNPSSRSSRKENLMTRSNKSEVKKEQNDNLKQTTEEIAIDNVVKTETTESNSKSKNEKPIDKARKTELSEYNPYDKSNADWQAPKKTKKQNSWLVAASVNTGGRAFFGNDAMDMAPENIHDGDYQENPGENITSGDPNEEPKEPSDKEPSTGGNNPGLNNNYPGTILGNGDFSNVTHLPPLSFGLRVRKDFNKHFALESGLTYTYLSSKFSSGNSYGKEATLNMHYLGIPVNAVVYFVNNSKWNVYFLAGGMVEKGIWSNYWERNYLSNGKSYDYSDSDHIKGLQWSLNASFGVGYNFYRNFSIYFEPNIAYYLENNQPLSVRTESPLIVGLSAGIRYRIN